MTTISAHTSMIVLNQPKREKIARDTEEFLARNGRVTEVASDVFAERDGITPDRVRHMNQCSKGGKS